MDNDKTIVARTYTDLATAEYAAAVLAENGIDSFVGDRNWLQLYPMFAQQTDGYKLHIFEHDADKATQILDAIGDEANN